MGHNRDRLGELQSYHGRRHHHQPLDEEAHVVLTSMAPLYCCLQGSYNRCILRI